MLCLQCQQDLNLLLIYISHFWCIDPIKSEHCAASLCKTFALVFPEPVSCTQSSPQCQELISVQRALFMYQDRKMTKTTQDNEVNHRPFVTERCLSPFHYIPDNDVCKELLHLWKQHEHCGTERKFSNSSNFIPKDVSQDKDLVLVQQSMERRSSYETKK